MAELREQARHATASTGCECGCVTLDLHVPEDLPASPARTEARVERPAVDARGEPIGGVRLFVENGRLAGLEVCSDDERPRVR